MFSFKLSGMKQGKLLESEQNYIVEQKTLWKNIFLYINIQRVNWLKYYNKSCKFLYIETINRYYKIYKIAT